MPTTARRIKALEFLIKVSPVTRAVVWRGVLNVLGSDLVELVIDLYPDESWPSFRELPESVRAAHGVLRALPVAKARDPKMGVHVDLRDRRLREAVASFGPFSIHVSGHGRSGEELCGMHDEGMSCWVTCTDEQIERLREESRSRGADSSIEASGHG